MKDLVIPLKGEYFNAIQSGEKKEEFRLCTPYWEKRLVNREYGQIILTLGYPKRTDTARRLTLPYKGWQIKTITHPHFGSEPVRVYAIDVAH